MKKCYSQLSQDLIAQTFFQIYPTKKTFFLDVGAFDGIGFSNTRLFFDNHWNGICIEPVTKNYKKLETLYRNTNIITVRAAATDFDGELVLNVATIPSEKEWGSDVSSSSDETIQRWPDYIWTKETVPARTINSILNEHNIEFVTFVSIDVEGQEMAVLRGFNLQKYQPALLVVEYSSQEEHRELTQHMRTWGYFPWIDNHQDIFFVRNELRNWKIFIYGLYQNLKVVRTGQLIQSLVKLFTK